MSEHVTGLDFWMALHNYLQNALATLPYADDPDRIHWDHPDEEWKNEAEMDAIQEGCAPETDKLIETFCRTRRWPKRSKNNVRYFAARRLEWGLKFTRLLTIADPATGEAVIPRTERSGFEFLEWLLIHAYYQRHAPPAKTSFYVSGPRPTCG